MHQNDQVIGLAELSRAFDQMMHYKYPKWTCHRSNSICVHSFQRCPAKRHSRVNSISRPSPFQDTLPPRRPHRHHPHPIGFVCRFPWKEHFLRITNCSRKLRSCGAGNNRKSQPRCTRGQWTKMRPIKGVRHWWSSCSGNMQLEQLFLWLLSATQVASLVELKNERMEKDLEREILQNTVQFLKGEWNKCLGQQSRGSGRTKVNCAEG